MSPSMALLALDARTDTKDYEVEGRRLLYGRAFQWAISIVTGLIYIASFH